MVLQLVLELKRLEHLRQVPLQQQEPVLEQLQLRRHSMVLQLEQVLAPQCHNMVLEQVPEQNSK